MDLITAWKSFQQTVRDAQEAVDILHGYFQQQDVNVWQQTRRLERNDKKELLALLAKLEPSLSEQTTAGILDGLRPLFHSVNVIGAEPGAYRSEIGPSMDRLRDVVRGFSDDMMRDAADGDLCLRVCPRYLKLRDVVQTLTILEHAYSTSTVLEQALADQTPQDTEAPEGAGRQPVAPTENSEEIPDDPIAEALTHQPLTLYLFLRDRKHWTNFDTMSELDCWRSNPPSDAAVIRGLRRLRDELNQIERTPISLVIEKKHRRCKLDK